MLNENHDIKAVELTIVNDEIQAAMLIGELEAAGIKAVACGVLTSGMRVEVPAGVHIMVSENDYAEALELFKIISENVASLDWDNVDVGQSQGP